MNATARRRATPVNIAHHVRLLEPRRRRQRRRPVSGEAVQLLSSRYSRVDAALMHPDGRPGGWRPRPARPTTSSRRRPWAGKLLPCAVGYDTNYAVDGAAAGTAPVSRVRDGATGRAMELWADQPGVAAACSSTRAAGSAASGERAGVRCTGMT